MSLDPILILPVSDVDPVHHIFSIVVPEGWAVECLGADSGLDFAIEPLRVAPLWQRTLLRAARGVQRIVRVRAVRARPAPRVAAPGGP